MIKTALIVVLVPFFLVMVVLKVQRIWRWPWLEAFLSRVDCLNDRRRKRRLPVIESLFILIFLIFFTMASLTRRRSAPWSEGQIVVVADSTDWDIVENALRQNLEREVRTPQPEKTFHLRHTSLADFRRRRDAKFVILAATINPGGPVSSWVFDQLLSGREGFRWEGGTYIALENLWVEGQTVIVLAGENPSAVDHKIRSTGDSLYSRLEDAFYTGLEGTIFASRDERHMAKQLMESYGWSLERQSDLILLTADSSERVILFGSWKSGRWLFVRWYENVDYQYLNPDWIIAERDRIGEAYLGGKTVEPYYLHSQEGRFLGRRALITTGLWADSDPVIGGPFHNVTFYDETSGRSYMIDCSVHAAGDEKLPILRRLRVLARSFVVETVWDGDIL